jgi:hypothetical protein
MFARNAIVMPKRSSGTTRGATTRTFNTIPRANNGDNRSEKQDRGEESSAFNHDAIFSRKVRAVLPQKWSENISREIVSP